MTNEEIAVFNEWRKNYDSMSYEEHKTFYQKLLKKYPDQKRFKDENVLLFFRIINRLERHKDLRVFEFGGYDGRLANTIISQYKSSNSNRLLLWDNYEIFEVAKEDSKCQYFQYRQAVFNSFLWDICQDQKEFTNPLEGYNLFLSSHTIEHLSWDHLKKLFDILPTTINYIYLEAPLEFRGQKWDNYFGTHKLTKGWKHILLYLDGLGFTWQFELSNDSYLFIKKLITPDEIEKGKYPTLEYMDKMIDEEKQRTKKESERKIGLHMIVRDCAEELERCLESAKGLYDEGYLSITITDNNFWVDNIKTLNVCKKYGAIVTQYESEDIDDTRYLDNFSAARNLSLDNLPADTDFVIVLDSDFIVHEPLELRGKIQQLFQKITFNSFTLELKEYDKDCNAYYMAVRGWTAGACRWKGRVHNRPVPLGKKGEEIRIARVTFNDLHITHAHDNKLRSKELRYERTTELLKLSIKEEPTNTRNWYYLAREYLSNEEWVEAMAWFKMRVWKEDYTYEHWNSTYQIAICYSKMGLWKNAYSYAIKTLAINPSHPEPYVLIGVYLFVLEKFDQALQWFTHAKNLPTPMTGWFDYVNQRTTIPEEWIISCMEKLYQRDGYIIVKTLTNALISVAHKSGKPAEVFTDEKTGTERMIPVTKKTEVRK